MKTPSAALVDAQKALDTAGGLERAQRLADFNGLLAVEARITIRDVATGEETFVDSALGKSAVRLGAGDAVIFAAANPEGESEIYRAGPDGEAVALTNGAGNEVLGNLNSTGTALLFTVRARGGGRGGGRGGPGPGGAVPAAFGVILLPEGKVVTSPGTAPAFSRDGSSMTFLSHEGAETRVMA